MQTGDWIVYLLIEIWSGYLISCLWKDLRDGKGSHDNFYYFMIILYFQSGNSTQNTANTVGIFLAANNCTDCNTDWTIQLNLGCNIFGIRITGVSWYQGTPWTSDIVTMLLENYYTPAQRSWRGGILDSPCPSVCPSVRLSVDDMVSGA